VGIPLEQPIVVFFGLSLSPKVLKIVNPSPAQMAKHGPIVCFIGFASFMYGVPALPENLNARNLQGIEVRDLLSTTGKLL
jgi:hypothetical protein